jgi:predicted site-specific integrase-resolvase
MTEQLEGELARCSASLAARLLGVTAQTVRNWAKAGKINATPDPTGRRQRYDVRPFVKKTVTSPAEGA